MKSSCLTAVIQTPASVSHLDELPRPRPPCLPPPPLQQECSPGPSPAVRRWEDPEGGGKQTNGLTPGGRRLRRRGSGSSPSCRSSHKPVAALESAEPVCLAAGCKLSPGAQRGGHMFPTRPCSCSTHSVTSARGSRCVRSCLQDKRHLQAD